MKSILRISIAISLMAVLTIPCWAGVLFEDDFESGEIDTNKWQPTGNWQLVAPDTDGLGLGNFVLDIMGGEAGISVQNDFADFYYSADFQAMENSLTGFVFRAQDSANNFYMHQISVTGSGHTPNNVRWHWKVGGSWNVEPIPFLDGVELQPNTWYHAMFAVQGFNFKVSVIEKAKQGQEEMQLIGDWTDEGSNFATGAIGFRSSGAEHMQFDNIVMSTEPTAVEHVGKLSTTWARIKSH